MMLYPPFYKYSYRYPHMPYNYQYNNPQKSGKPINNKEFIYNTTCVEEITSTQKEETRKRFRISNI